MAIIGAAVLFSSGCALLGQSNSNSYHYAAFDDAGVATTTGTITLVFSPSSSADHEWDLTGTWRFNPVGATTPQGVDVGSGRLEGWVNDDESFSFDTHPGVADNNFVLRGSSLTEDSKEFSGTWEAIGFAGVIATGTFTAKR